MLQKIFSFILCFLLASFAKAQFGTPEENQLQQKGIALAKAGKKSEAMTLVNRITDYSTKLTGIEGIIEGLFEYGNRKEAMRLAKQHLDSIEVQVNNKKIPAFNYSNMAVPYARFLMKKGLANESYPILKKVIDRGGVMHFSTPELYAETLVKSGHYEEAIKMINTMIIKGSATPYVMDTLYHEAYLRLNRTEKGFNAQKDSVMRVWKLAVRDSVEKKMIRQQAPDFVLKNAEGREIRLSALKGKTVVVDFWATWCTPCKASFPVMKMAKDRFKEDTSVVFLFVHTMERNGVNPVPEAVSYMNEHNFDFEVLFDLRDPETKVSPVMKSYDVRGIPTKIVIDPAGEIRFVSIGGTNLSHTDAMATEHMVAMVQLAAAK